MSSFVTARSLSLVDSVISRPSLAILRKEDSGSAQSLSINSTWPDPCPHDAFVHPLINDIFSLPLDQSSALSNLLLFLPLHPFLPSSLPLRNPASCPSPESLPHLHPSPVLKPPCHPSLAEADGQQIPSRASYVTVPLGVSATFF